MKKVVTLANGERRTLTAPVLVAGLAAFKKQRSAEQARAYDAGLRAAKGRVANNAISAALLQSNRSAGQSTARAIDQMFTEVSHAEQELMADVFAGIEKPRKYTGPAMTLDQAIDGHTPQQPVSISKFIDDL